MDLKKLFSVQKVLRDRINYNEPDRFDKLVLALLVEVGECAQEWRGFKFWSKDQEPRTKIKCEVCEGNKEIFSHYPEFDMIECPHCDGTGIEKPGNPLLEEYVDGVHFILDLGLEIGITIESDGWEPDPIRGNNVTDMFTDVFESITEFSRSSREYEWVSMFESYIGLGKKMGFTWNEVEAAYMEKNEINHKRQDSGTY